MLELNQIVTKQDINDGSLIMISSRPAVGKTYTCNEIIKQFKGEYEYLYFNLNGDRFSFFFNNSDKSVITEYHSSVEIIKRIEKTWTEKLKFVFIDYWQLINDKGEWFLKILLELSWSLKLVIIINSQLDRKVDYRKKRLPKEKDLTKINPLYEYSKKVVVINRPAMWSDVEDKMHYYIYKDWRNNYFCQEQEHSIILNNNKYRK